MGVRMRRATIAVIIVVIFAAVFIVSEIILKLPGDVIDLLAYRPAYLPSGYSIFFAVEPGPPGKKSTSFGPGVVFLKTLETLNSQLADEVKIKTKALSAYDCTFINSSGLKAGYQVWAFRDESEPKNVLDAIQTRKYSAPGPKWRAFVINDHLVMVYGPDEAVVDELAGKLKKAAGAKE